MATSWSGRAERSTTATWETGLDAMAQSWNWICWRSMYSLARAARLVSTVSAGFALAALAAAEPSWRTRQEITS
jgi:hypothetical protein